LTINLGSPVRGSHLSCRKHFPFDQIYGRRSEKQKHSHHRAGPFTPLELLFSSEFRVLCLLLKPLMTFVSQ